MSRPAEAGQQNREQPPDAVFERRCLLAAGGLLIVAAWISIGFHQYDEHFQVLEFANFKIGLTPALDLPWEMSARIRSWFLPAVAVVVMRALRALGDADPFHAAIVLRLCSGLLYWAALARLLGCSRCWFRSQSARRLAIVMSCGLWFVPYLAVRFSGEAWSGALFFLGFVSLIRKARGEPVSSGELGLAGLAMGLAFAARYQSALLIVAALAWFAWIGRARVPALAAVTGGLVAALAVSLIVDRWGYGVWTFAPWNYLDTNLVMGVAVRRFGASPWWWYLGKFVVAAGPPIGLPVMIGVFIAWWRRPVHPLTWVSMSFFLAHCLLGHKELRFLFPLLLATPFLACLGLDTFPATAERWLRSRAGRALGVVLLLLNTVGLALRLAVPGRAEIGVQRAVYYSGVRQLLTLRNADPYEMGGLRSDFYRPPALVTSAQADAIGRLNTEGIRQPVLIAELRPLGADTAGLHCSVIYQSYPTWVEQSPIWGRLQWAEPRQWRVARCQQ